MLFGRRRHPPMEQVSPSRPPGRRLRWRHRAPARWPGLELWIAAACRPSSDVFGGRECQAERLRAS
eukprot:scaffold1567_cov106-Isochrysis_galbana.AAC.16